MSSPTTTRTADRGLAGQEECRGAAALSSPSFLTGDQAAALLNVSRRTLYRWAESGYIARDWWMPASLTPYIGIGKKRRARNPHAVRYTTGRHRFDEVRGKRRNAVGFSASEGGEGG